MGTNRAASVILLDVSQSMSAETDNGKTFFERSLECLKKMILRKMFSQDEDELGIILFGTDDTENDLARSMLYNHISVFSRLYSPNWELFRKVENLAISNRTKCNWIEALVVAIDFMKSQTQGRKFKNKQIVVFSSFSDEIKGDEDTIQPLVATLAGENISLIVVGSEMSDEYERKELFTSSLHLILNTVNQLDTGIHYSFTDIEKELMYFEKKRKMARLVRVSLCIGSKLKLPLRWMKITKDETRFRWEQILRDKSQYSAQKSGVQKLDPGDGDDHNNEIKFITDVVKTTNFGATFVELGYADLEALKRKTGAPSFVYLGSVKSSKISRSMFVGSDLYTVVPDKDARSVAMFSAFVDALIKSGKYGIARRVAVRNGRITVGALLPISDELGKTMSYLKLPYQEWVQKMPEKPLPEPDNEEGRKAIDDLIKAAMLPEDIAEEGKGLLVRDPTFQSRCHALYQRAVGKLPETSIIDFPDCVKHIINPFPLNEEAKNALQRIATIFPFVEVEEKPGASKSKTDQSFNNESNVVSAAEAAKVKEEFEMIKRDPGKATADPYGGYISDDLFDS